MSAPRTLIPLRRALLRRLLGRCLGAVVGIGLLALVFHAWLQSSVLLPLLGGMSFC
ncbi:hypothetical protein BRI6_2281 [plant metagenome]|uniref:Uncharacterized protein n=1 Tax=plant metagenome TaxID=1297885 RepID=A0A484UNR2_9ZZZZ